MPFGLRAFNAGIVTKPLPLPEISIDPTKPITLQVRHAGRDNPAWDSWWITQPADEPPPGGTVDTPDARLAARAKDRARVNALMAVAVIVGWDNVSEDGKPVEFSPDACQRFLDELIVECPDVLDRIQRFTMAIGNFRAARVDPAALGKG